VLPLVVASGAGKVGRQSVGTAVFGGMLISTFLNLIFIPVLYVGIRSLRPGGTRGGGEPGKHGAPALTESRERELVAGD
jgi:HAE1 family hydrophobic/amphiphilic exporter-1